MKFQAKIAENVIKSKANCSNIHKNLNPDNSLEKTKFNYIFFIPYSALDDLFNDTHTTLYDEYIDRSKLNETKKPI